MLELYYKKEKKTDIKSNSTTMYIDETDKKILRLLQKDAHLTLKDIANEINLSLTPVHDRVKKLEKDFLSFRSR